MKMSVPNLLEISKNRKPVEVLLKDLTDENMGLSLSAGQNLVAKAKKAQLCLPDYLRLAVDVNTGDMKDSKLDGYEASLAHLNLPIRDDFQHGVLLEAAAETFQTYPGTRALFPVVIDDIVQWKYRQDQIESIDPIIGQTRTINGTELLTTVVDDKAGDYQVVGVIAEASNIPTRSIRTSERSVKIYKFGGGYEFTYEFERRARLDLITPFAMRNKREMAIAQVAMATATLLNGDGVAPAAPVVTATSLAAAMPAPPTIVAGRLNWEIFLSWVISRAKIGVPIDTVIGGWDMYLEWLRMFQSPQSNAGISQGQILANAGVHAAIANPSFGFNVNFALSSSMPAGKLLGIIKAETLDEIVENGSDIEEAIRSMDTQTIKYVRTTNRGYKLNFSDTRSVLNLV
jgi:hypothetical protein